MLLHTSSPAVLLMQRYHNANRIQSFTPQPREAEKLAPIFPVLMQCCLNANRTQSFIPPCTAAVVK